MQVSITYCRIDVLRWYSSTTTFRHSAVMCATSGHRNVPVPSCAHGGKRWDALKNFVTNTLGPTRSTYIRELPLQLDVVQRWDGAQQQHAQDVQQGAPPAKLVKTVAVGTPRDSSEAMRAQSALDACFSHPQRAAADESAAAESHRLVCAAAPAAGLAGVPVIFRCIVLNLALVI